MDILVDPDNQNPFTYYINDEFYWAFSTKTGMEVGLYVRTQLITTDYALLPVEDIRNITSPVVEPAQLSTYAIYDAEKQYYVYFYVLPSSTSVRITRSFYKFDGLLAYIGGLFGILTLLLELPLRAYNQTCNDVGLGHYVYDYREGIPEQASTTETELVSKIHGIDDSAANTKSAQSVAPLDSGVAQSSKPNHAHSFRKFNFFVFAALSLYRLVRKCDAKKRCRSQRLEPYVDSIEWIHKEVDMRLLLQRLLVLERAVKCLLPERLYLLLPYFQREDVRHNSGLHNRFKHFKHLINDKHSEDDEMSMKELRRLVGEARNAKDAESIRVLS